MSDAVAEAGLDAIEREIEVALAQVAADNPVDAQRLADLGDRLCRHLLGLPREQARRHAPRLVALVARLDALAQTLEQARTRLDDHLKAAGGDDDADGGRGR